MSSGWEAGTYEAPEPFIVNGRTIRLFQLVGEFPFIASVQEPDGSAREYRAKTSDEAIGAARAAAERGPMMLTSLVNGAARQSAKCEPHVEITEAIVDIQAGQYGTEPVPLICIECKRTLCEVRPPVGELSIRCKRCGFQNTYRLK